MNLISQKEFKGNALESLRGSWYRVKFTSKQEVPSLYMSHYISVNQFLNHAWYNWLMYFPWSHTDGTCILFHFLLWYITWFCLQDSVNIIFPKLQRFQSPFCRTHQVPYLLSSNTKISHEWKAIFGKIFQIILSGWKSFQFRVLCWDQLDWLILTKWI